MGADREERLYLCLQFVAAEGFARVVFRECPRVNVRLCIRLQVSCCLSTCRGVDSAFCCLFPVFSP